MEREARRLSVKSSKSGLTKDIQVVTQDSSVCSNFSLILFITLFFSDAYLFLRFFICRAGWNRIFSLSLFVENVLLGIEEVERTLRPLVLEHTQQLGKVDLCTFLNA